jgi:hypothetical protein
MNLRLISLAAIAAVTVSPAFAKAPTNPEYAQGRKDIAAMRTVESLAPTASTVGDIDSFGRSARYLGYIQSGLLLVQSDCSVAATGTLGPDDHCVTTNPAPATTAFSFQDVGRMIIPGKSSNSLFCHTQTPLVIYSFSNGTGVYQPSARIVVTPSYKIENPVLNDPSLIDPNTGLPFNGSFTVSISGVRHSRSLQPGETQVERDAGTRACIAGIVSKSALISSYGLTAAQASKFFSNDTIITMNLQGSTTMVDFAQVIYGTRIMGD